MGVLTNHHVIGIAYIIYRPGGILNPAFATRYMKLCTATHLARARRNEACVTSAWILKGTPFPAAPIASPTVSAWPPY